MIIRVANKNDYTCCYCFIVLFLLVIALALIYTIFVNVNYLVNIQFQSERVVMIFLAAVISSAIIGVFGYFIIISELSKSPEKGAVIMRENTVIQRRSRTIPKDIEPWKKELEKWKPGEKNKVTRYITEEVRRRVWRRDEGKCVDCGSKELLEFDHIIPVSRGGSNTARNIQLLCEKCNRTKADEI